MIAPVAALLGDTNRLHLQHGPIDLVIGVNSASRDMAFRAAQHRFDTILQELVSELALLRTAIGSARPTGQVARRMDTAARSFATGTFVTPMAAVAGAVADEVLAAMQTAGPLTRAYVNNGGDIALFLGQGTQYAAAIAGLDGSDHGRIQIDASSKVRGIATSGQGGRSLSFGIAKSVTVLARNAAQADVAATLIANAVDLPGHPSVVREPARDLDPDSDLGKRLVVTHVGPLARADIETALNAGARLAQTMYHLGLIEGAALFLRQSQRIVGALPQSPAKHIKNGELCLT